MGQRIEIEGTRVVDDSVIVTTDRSLTGTDGEGYSTVEEADASQTFAAGVARRLLADDGAINRVFVSSNVVVVRRDGGWNEDATASTSKVIEEFFLFYPDA